MLRPVKVYSSVEIKCGTNVKKYMQVQSQFRLHQIEQMVDVGKIRQHYKLLLRQRIVYRSATPSERITAK